MMTSFRCYDDSDVNANLLIINFCLCLVTLWKSFFHISIDSDIVKRGVKGVLRKYHGHQYGPRKTVSKHLKQVDFEGALASV